MKIKHPVLSNLLRRIVMAVMMIALSVSLAWAGQPTDQLKETLNQMITTLNNPTLKAKNKVQEKRNALHNILKCRFDQEALAERALGNHWNKITPEEKQAFIKVFIPLLEKTYFDKIDAQLATTGDISGENIHYINEMVKGDYAQVETKILAGEAAPIPVIYRLKNNQGNWYVVDMAIEGVIITKNYRAQFDEILARDSLATLIKTLQDKLASP